MHNPPEQKRPDGGSMRQFALFPHSWQLDHPHPLPSACTLFLLDACSSEIPKSGCICLAVGKKKNLYCECIYLLVVYWLK